MQRKFFLFIVLGLLIWLPPQLTGATLPTERQCCKIAPGDPNTFPSINASPVIHAGSTPIDVIVDGSFEVGSPNPNWNEASTNFGTPLCTIDSCGTGTGTGPKTGDWWAWFGGIDIFEEGSLSQTVNIPPGCTAMLNFQFENKVCSNTSDFLEVRVDGNQVWIIYASNPYCGNFGYSPINIDLSKYADGGFHLIEFHSITYGPDVTNFFVDDVQLILTPSTTAMPIPTINGWGIMIMSLVILMVGIIAMRNYSTTKRA